MFGAYLLILDFLAESLKANKTSKKRPNFKIQIGSKNLTYFKNLNSLNIMKNILPQHNQKHVSSWCHCILEALHSRSTWKLNVCIFQ